MHARRDEPAQSENTVIDGRYRVMELLGRGGAGAVYRVRDEAKGRYVALKRLGHEAPANLRAMFEREYRTLAGIRHPNIVGALEYGLDDGVYYTMELLDGEDFSAHTVLPYEEVCDVMRQALAGLALLHARKLVHRDVSAANIWRTSSGVIKLIDFGALAPFGAHKEVVGTPPFVAPEALDGEPLGAYSDLYSVGALGYRLLTGRHAYPARSLAELRAVHQSQPTRLERAVPPGTTLPPELIRLISSLIRAEPSERPSSAEEVIDRLVSISAPHIEAVREPSLVRGYLDSSRLVGRRTVMERAEQLLIAASQGQANSLLIEGRSGMGCTRVLEEIAVEARILGAKVIRVVSSSEREVFGCAAQIANEICDVVPRVALEGAKPYAPVLSHLSRRLRERLGLSDSELAELPVAPDERRVRIQIALHDWLSKIAEQQFIVLVLDDLPTIDSASASWLAALGQTRDRRLFIATSARLDEGTDNRLAAQVFRRQAQRCRLEALSADDVREFVSSIFGTATYVPRVAEALHRRSEGNPAILVELVRHLVSSRLATFADGSWILPDELTEDHLPELGVARQIEQLRQLPDDERGLAELLSVHEGAISLDFCAAISGLPPSRLHPALEGLIANRVLLRSGDSYAFRGELLVSALRAGIEASRLREIHRIIAAQCVKDPLDDRDRVRVGLHFLEGGELERGVELVHAGATALAMAGPEGYEPIPSHLERALELMRRARLSERVQLPVLAALGVLAYLSDRSLASRYGDDLVAVLRRFAGLDVASMLRALVGRRISLVVGLAWGYLRAWRNPSYDFRQGISMLVHGIAALTGCSALGLDPRSARRFAAALEPFAALGRGHILSTMYRYCSCIAASASDRHTEAELEWRRLLELLDAPALRSNTAEVVRNLFLSGAYNAFGIKDAWKDSHAADESARRLAEIPLRACEMSAHQILATSAGHRGELERSNHHRIQVEMIAMQRGVGWQVEVWVPISKALLGARLHDALMIKQAVEQLHKLAEDVPQMSVYARRSLGTYLVIRRRYAEAIAYLEDVLESEPNSFVGWARYHAVLAAAYNGLGRHQRALEVLARAIEWMDPRDLSYLGLNLSVQIEHAIALAGVGEVARARAMLDAWLEQHSPNRGALTLGALHDARARVALLESDSELFELHLSQVEYWYGLVGAPSLAEHCRELARSGRGLRSDADGRQVNNEECETELGHVIAPRRILPSVERGVEFAKEILQRLLKSEQGWVFARDSDGVLECIQSLGHPPSSGLALALQHLLDTRSDERTMTAASVSGVCDTRCELHVDHRRYRYWPLCRWTADGDLALGALVTLAESRLRPDIELLEQLAQLLPGSSRRTLH